MKDKVWTILIILGVLILSIIIISSNNPNQVSEEFTKRLGENSTLYVSNGCHYCINQLKIFGDYAEYLNIIDCTKEPNKCLESGLTSVPTWIINGKKYVGIKSIEELKELINSC